MNQAPLDPVLFNRLALARDLATRGIRLLRGTPNPFDAIQGIVLLDHSVEIAMKIVVAELGRQTNGDKFRDLLDAIPELQNRADIQAMHSIRNVAQHRGVAPRSNECDWARRVGLDALRVLFRFVSADCDTLSLLVARCALRFENEWPDLLLVESDKPDS